MAKIVPSVCTTTGPPTRTVEDGVSVPNVPALYVETVCPVVPSSLEIELAEPSRTTKPPWKSATTDASKPRIAVHAVVPSLVIAWTVVGWGVESEV